MPKRKAKEAKGDGVSKKKSSSFKGDDFFVDSESEEEDISINGTKKDINEDEESEEEVEETADEKRIRMAKEYLKSLEDEDELSDDVEDPIAHRLQQDILRDQGTLQRNIANNFANQEYTASDVTILRGHRLPPTCLALSKDDTTAVTGSKDGSIIKWDIESGKKCSVTKHGKDGCHDGQVLSVALGDDGRFLVSGGTDNVVKVWDVRSNTVIEDFLGHRDSVSALAFQRGTNQLFSGSYDRTIRVWNLDTMGFVEQLFGHQAEITTLDSLHRNRALSSGGDKTLRLWKIVEETQLMYKGGHTGAVDCASLLTEDTYFSGGQNGSIALWLAQKKKPSSMIKRAHGGEWIVSVDAHSYSDLLCSGSSDGFVRLWKTETQGPNKNKLAPVSKIPVVGFVNGVRISNDTKFVVAAVGQEHRFGRWQRIQKARNGIQICRLKENEDVQEEDDSEQDIEELDEDEGDYEGDYEGEDEGGY